MVERPADVLPMDPAQPAALSTFARADQALRKMPGLGVVIFIVVLEQWYSTGHWIGVAVMVIGAIAMLLEEFTSTPGRKSPRPPVA